MKGIGEIIYQSFDETCFTFTDSLSWWYQGKGRTPDLLRGSALASPAIPIQRSHCMLPSPASNRQPLLLNPIFITCPVFGVHYRRMEKAS